MVIKTEISITRWNGRNNAPKKKVMLYKESKQTLIGFLPSFYIKKGGNRDSIQISNKFYNQAV